LIGDLSVDNKAYQDERISRSIEAYVQMLSNDVYQGLAWVDPFVTLIAGTSDYTATSGEYGEIVELRLNSQGWLIERLTTAEMERMRVGTSASRAPGDVTRYSIIENTTQGLLLRFWPWPNKSDTVAALLSVLVGSLSTDSSAIPFNAPLCRAVEFFVASDLVTAATPEQLQAMIVSKDAVPVWRANAEKAVIKEKERQNRLKTVRSVTRADRGVW
jgi:hypothetical protein